VGRIKSKVFGSEALASSPIADRRSDEDATTAHGFEEGEVLGMDVRHGGWLWGVWFGNLFGMKKPAAIR
jgi:hypothetical protein